MDPFVVLAGYDGGLLDAEFRHGVVQGGQFSFPENPV
jgi:hypothetical protein